MADTLFWIADEINRLPRRCLDYRTPDELFEEQLDKVYKFRTRNTQPPTVHVAIAIEDGLLEQFHFQFLDFYRASH